MTTNKLPSDPALNERVKQVRLALGVSQARFSKGIFLANSHYNGIEQGIRRVNDRTIKLLVSIYGVNEGFLRTGEGEMFDKPPDLRLERLIRLFNALPPAYQDCVLRQIEALKTLHDA